MLRVKDMSGNVGEVTRLVEVRGPDLEVGMEPKVKPKKDISEGDKVKITVNVTNKGEVAAENVTVRVYWKKIDDEHIVGDELIEKLEPQGAQNITISWKDAQRGEKMPLIVVIDPDDKIKETNEENNNWTVKIKVKKDWVLVIVLSIIGGILIVIIGAYVVYRRFFGPEDEDEDRSERRKKAGKKGGRKRKDEDEDDEEGIGGKVKGFFKRSKDDDDDDYDDDDDDDDDD
jgi:hypothetical protein